jgi:membrane-associated protein
MHSLSINWMSPEALIQAFGLFGVFVILFAETGLLLGFFLPGDSLLFLAGVAASSAALGAAGTSLPLPALLIGAPISAIVGAQLGHYLGATVGRRIFGKPGRQDGLRRAEEYFRKFGPAKAIILGRYVGVVRTFINPFAGTVGVPAKKFFLLNVVGALLWTDGIILIGYLVGDALPGGIDAYLLPVVLLIMFVSLLPLFIGVVRSRRGEAAPASAAAGQGQPEPEGSEAAAVPGLRQPPAGKHQEQVPPYTVVGKDTD